MKEPDNSSIIKLEFPKNISWPIRDIVTGIIFLLAWKLIFPVIYNANAFRYRPWLSTYIDFTFEVVLFSSLFAYSFYICKKRCFWPLIHSIRLSKIVKEVPKGLLYLLIMSLAIVPVLALAVVIFKAKLTTDATVQWMRNDPNSYLTLSIMIIAMTIGPIAEEFYIRGFLYNALKSHLPIWLATIVQAILFSAMHNVSEGIMSSLLIFLIGIALAIIYEHRKDLLPVIVVHSLKNALIVIPLLILAIQNYHTPSANWNEAEMNPSWISQANIENIKRQEHGLEQVQFAINTWGSKGKKQWKQEAIAFNAVLRYFPDDRAACAKAISGLSEIYAYHLRDYRRAVKEADLIQSQYADQREQFSHALLKKAYAYIMLNDFDNARRSYQKVLDEFKDIKNDQDAALDGINGINYLEN